jgi:hypothetical protein
MMPHVSGDLQGYPSNHLLQHQPSKTFIDKFPRLRTQLKCIVWKISSVMPHVSVLQHLGVLPAGRQSKITGLFGSQPHFAKLNFGCHSFIGRCLVLATLWCAIFYFLYDPFVIELLSLPILAKVWLQIF